MTAKKDAENTKDSNVVSVESTALLCLANAWRVPFVILVNLPLWALGQLLLRGGDIGQKLVDTVSYRFPKVLRHND